MAIPYYSMDLDSRELKGIFKKVFSRFAFNGPSIKEYEQLISSSIGVKYVIPFPSGRTGFYYLMKCLFKEGDEVIVSIYTFPFFVRLLHEMGVKPVFVDIERDYALINVDLIEEKITPRTKGVLVTHLFGNACDMERIVEICNRRKIHLIEDCAHAFGSKYKGKPVGNFGTASVFSTSPMKVPTTLGGGFVATNDEDIYDEVLSALYSSEGYKYSYKKLYALFTYTLIYYLNSFPAIFSILTSRIFRYLKAKNPGGLRKLFYSELVSTKPFDPFERLRFSNMQAQVGIYQIQRFDAMTQKRRKYAKIYESLLEDCQTKSVIKEKPDCFNNYLYDIAIVKDNCDKFLDDAMDKGLFLMREDCWYCNSYDFASQYQQDCPVGKELQNQLVRLPNSSLLSEEKIQMCAKIIKESK